MTRDKIVAGGVSVSYLDEGRGAPVLVLHGFTGSSQSMRVLTQPLCNSRRVIAPDLIGHGHTEAPLDIGPYTVDEMCIQLTGLLAALELGSVDVVGYSMGGRLALSFAAAHQPLVRRMVVIGTTAGLEAEGERRDRVEADEAMAARIEADGVEAFVDYWQALPIFASQRHLADHTRNELRRGRLSNTRTGLANSLHGAGVGAMPSLWHLLDRVETPTLVVAGELDEKYVALGQRLVTELPAGRLEVVRGTGHAVHLEAPERCAEVVEGFLSS